MSLFARQSTADTFIVGPILDADGVAVTDAVIGDLKLSKNGADPVAFDGAATLTHRHTGHYLLMATADDLDTVGQAEVVIDDTTNVMPVKTVTVLEEAVYDALFDAGATGLLPANVTQWLGTAPRALVDQNVQTHVRDAGYEGGYVYLDNAVADGGTGQSGTVLGVNGTVDNPCATMQDAYDVAQSLRTSAIRLLRRGGTSGGDPKTINVDSLDLSGLPLELDLNGRYCSFNVPLTFQQAKIYSSVSGGLILGDITFQPGSYLSDLTITGSGLVLQGGVDTSHKNIIFSENCPEFSVFGASSINLYYPIFVRSSPTRIVFDYSVTGAAPDVLLNGLYGNVQIEGIQGNDRVLALGWGSLTIDRTTSSGGVIDTVTHVRIFDEAGNKYVAENGTFVVGDTTVNLLTQEEAGDIDGFSRDQALRVIAAATAGVLSGGPSTPEMLGLDKATVRITGTADSFGNRTDVTYDGGS